MKKKFLIIIIVVVLIIGAVLVFLSRTKNGEIANIKIPILLYHDFVLTVPENDPDNFNYINTPHSFEENIKFLLSNGYTFISFEELNDANNGKISFPEKPILVTFDDGYYSNYEYIFPILKKYNIKASIFVVTDKIGKEIDGKKYLTWEQCAEMQNSGLLEIYSHSKRHLFYDKFPVRMVLDDVKESYKIIEEKLGTKDLKVFAYPYGAYTKETVWSLKLNGIDMQVYDLGMNYSNDFNDDYIKRFNIPCEMTGAEILEIINESF